MKREKVRVIKACFLTLIQLLLYYAVPYFVLLALGVNHVSIVEVIVLHVMIVMIVSLFPIPGGAGGAEYSFKTLFATYVASPSKFSAWHVVMALFNLLSRNDLRHCCNGITSKKDA